MQRHTYENTRLTTLIISFVMFWFHTFLCFVLFPVAVSVQRHDPEWDDPNRSTQFAVLVTGNSDTFDRGYMSQGSVAHAFHLFRNSGIPPHHITSLSPGNAPYPYELDLLVNSRDCRFGPFLPSQPNSFSVPVENNGERFEWIR